MLLVFPMAQAAVGTGAVGLAIEGLRRTVGRCCLGRASAATADTAADAEGEAGAAAGTGAAEETACRGDAEHDAAEQCVRRAAQGMVAGPPAAAVLLLSAGAPPVSVAASLAAAEGLLAPAWYALAADGAAAAAARRLPLVTCCAGGLGLLVSGSIYFCAGHHVPALLSGFGVLPPERVPFTLGLGTAALAGLTFVATAYPAQAELAPCAAAAWAAAGAVSAGGLLTLAAFPVFSLAVYQGHVVVSVSAAHELGALVFFAAGTAEAAAAACIPAECGVAAARWGCFAGAGLPFALLLSRIALSSAASAFALQALAAAALCGQVLTFDAELAARCCPTGREPDAEAGGGQGADTPRGGCGPAEAP